MPKAKGTSSLVKIDGDLKAPYSAESRDQILHVIRIRRVAEASCQQIYVDMVVLPVI